MNRRTFLKTCGIFSTITIHPNSVVIGCEERVRSSDPYHPLGSLEDDLLLWCRIDTYRSDLRKVKNWDHIEELIDRKLANAKETMMQLFKEHHDPDKLF